MSFHNHDTDDYNKKYSPSKRQQATKLGNQLLADHDKRKQEKAITALQQEAQINESKVLADERTEISLYKELAILEKQRADKLKKEVEQWKFDHETLRMSLEVTGDDNQKLIEHLKAIIQAWEEDEDIVINTGRKIREAQEYLNSRNSS